MKIRQIWDAKELSDRLAEKNFISQTRRLPGLDFYDKLGHGNIGYDDLGEYRNSDWVSGLVEYPIDLD